MAGRESETAASLRILLVERALEMLERGESDVSLRAVARAAGVSAMAPYRHFTDKAALMAAVALRGFRMLHERALAADADPDPMRALTAQGLAYVTFAREKPALFRLMFADGAGLALPKADCAGAHDVLAARVATLVPPDRVEAAVLGCWSLVHGLATLTLDGRVVPDLALEARALGMMTVALAAMARADVAQEKGAPPA